jgi:hypothetical protein
MSQLSGRDIHFRNDARSFGQFLIDKRQKSPGDGNQVGLLDARMAIPCAGHDVTDCLAWRASLVPTQAHHNPKAAVKLADHGHAAGKRKDAEQGLELMLGKPSPVA